MDEFAKHSSSYQLDQEILDARGINMTVEEVAGLSTCKYSEKVQALHLGEEDLAFLKGLRRRIKNRLASQNSRRRSMEHLRKLAKELRAVRACRDDALTERGSLIAKRELLRAQCARLRRHVVQILRQRSDDTDVPEVDFEQIKYEESQPDPSSKSPKIFTVRQSNYISEFKELDTKIFEEKMENERNIFAQKLEKDKTIFECRIDKLVQQSVNHIYREKEKKRVCAKTVFIPEKIMKFSESEELKVFGVESGVLNLSVKEGRRKSHGRKQSAPRRITYVYSDNDDGVLDLKIKKEPQ